jgi:hypothetical protein
MTTSLINEIETQIGEARGKDAHADIKPLLRRAISRAQTEDEISFVHGSLCSELIRELSEDESATTDRERISRAEEAIRTWTSAAPQDPYPWISLADLYAYYKGDFARAKTAIDSAIDRANEVKGFYRQAHGTRIRIALKLGDLRAVEASLKALVDWKPATGAPDVGLETDFLSRIPAGAIDKRVLDLYLMRAADRGKAGSAPASGQ